MIVMKFGGSSVASSVNIKQVLSIIEKVATPCVVVVSALGGCTDQLIELANLSLKNEFQEKLEIIRARHLNLINELIPVSETHDIQKEVIEILDRIEVLCKGIFLIQELSDATMAKMLSFGELLSSKIIAKAMQIRDGKAAWLDLGNLIITDDLALNANVNISLTKANVNSACASIETVCIAPGFISSDENGKRTTLGRGGSDFSASIVAASTDAEELIIWSDVNGILTSNPNIIPSAKTIPFLSYNEAFELSHFGAKVLYPPAIQPAFAKGISIQLKNTFAPQEKGSIIGPHIAEDDLPLTGVSNLENLALINIAGTNMVGIAGFSSRIFNRLNLADINVVLIAQSCSEHGICIAIKEDDEHMAREVLTDEFESEISNGYINEVEFEVGLTGLALVGDGMKHRVGISSQLFKELGDHGVNIKAIAQGSSESNISIIINAMDSKKALEVLHRRFFEDTKKEIHLFIAGIGNVGNELMKIIDSQQEILFQKYGFYINVCGLINSRKMVGFDDDKRSYTVVDLERSEVNADLDVFVDKILSCKMPNMIFVDNTASDNPSHYYKKLMKANVSLVACNKIGFAADMELFSDLQLLEHNGQANVRYETTVGAALPVISSIRSLVETGDKIVSIEAILSGSLSYIFNQYDGSKTFRSVVEDAMNLGFTEPDPRIDLSGKDVSRKIVIMARTSGMVLDGSDVILKDFLPKSCQSTDSIDEFLKELENNEEFFKNLYKKAKQNDAVLKFVAKYNNGVAEVGLYEVSKEDTMGSMKGQDNIILIKTQRYSEPLVIQGAGAGAELTASGVFADILSIIK